MPPVIPVTDPTSPPVETPMTSSTQSHPPTAPPGPTSNRNRRISPILAIVGAAVLVAAAVGATIVLTGHGSSPTAQTGSHSLASSPPKNYASFEIEYASLKNAIVRINSVGCDGNNYVGSGFVIDAHHIVTAGHVVEGSRSITVTIGGNPEPTEIIGLDTSGDVVLLHSDGAIPGSYIPLASDDPPVGDRVAAIGFPLGGGLTMTQGSVSALGQSIVVNNTQLAGLVQTDTALNPGNSGGPLLGLDGRASGIVDALNTQANATGYAISPKYAITEVDHWLVSPENHPLPLCASPNPLGSGPATPTPSAPSSPTTEPGTPIPTVPLSSQGTRAMGVVQLLASALAAHQWDQARSIYPLLGPDSQLAADYGALNASTVVITNESGSASSVNLTGAYVAWEIVNGNRQTSVYCIDWQVDPALKQVENQSAIASNLVGYQSQWVDPSALVPVVETQCVP
jgi:S1-C subfamily serine protease